MRHHNKIIIAAVYIACLLSSALCSQSCGPSFTLIDGSLCINGQFVHTINGVASEQQCALLCSNRPQCQAFSLSDGPCQLFVFDKCSKSVRDCGCSRRGRVFVRQQAGLSPGQLCPAGYGDDLCGVKYKVYSGSWDQIKSKCESESGLVIMADVTGAEEMSHVFSVRNAASSNHLWLGGRQPDGSEEPRGGWYWIGCNITIDSSLWASGEPNDDNSGQFLIAAYSNRKGLSDMTESSNHGMCECLSPFN